MANWQANCSPIGDRNNDRTTQTETYCTNARQLLTELENRMKTTGVLFAYTNIYVTDHLVALRQGVD